MPIRGVFDQIFPIWAAIAGGVFVIVTGLLLFALARNRARRREHLPFARDSNHKLESGYAVLLGLVVAGLVTGSFLAMHRVNSGTGLAPAAVEAPDAVHIDVTAFRWCWDFGYTTGKHVTGACTPGDYPTIVVPAGQPVDFAISSRDVVHGFWLPHFAAKLLAFPGHTNHMRMVFQDEGQWLGRCSEFCGNHHTTMDFHIKVVSPQQYQQFLAGGSVVGA